MIERSSKFKKLRRIGLDLTEDSKFEIHAIRPVRRVGPAGQLLMDLLVEITQWIPGYSGGDFKSENGGKCNFQFRGGCTLLIDMKTSRIRYAIVKDINDEGRYLRQQAYMCDSQTSGSLNSKFRSIFNGTRKSKGTADEPGNRSAKSGKMEE